MFAFSPLTFSVKYIIMVKMIRRCSSMVELQPSKLATGVRFPSPAPFFLCKNGWNMSVCVFCTLRNRTPGTRTEAPPGAEEARILWRSGRKKQAPTDAPIFSGTARGHRHFFGGLAQLVERLLRKQEVTGSTPVISTKTSKSELFRYDGTVRICFLL